ncbi:acetamidase/formamidase family protein [Aurantimonas sp. A2-1-M11]|uniref:acetamidase/formamidase family protein n=1 Tax=Aurantimonas sp. A2-1-M11 TaxID=3113712 RepID=UPI002F943F78
MAEHRFQPTRFYNTLGPAEPALAIAPGDTVITDTLDARGVDATGAALATRPNPMTGPFFVEGAEPGDTLRVTIERMTPSRDRGWTFSVLAPNVLDPERVAQMPERERVEWIIDREAGTVRLEKPSERLRDWVLPLAPMIGCCGVAPALGQAISTATSGPHGGNMDYRGIRAGTTMSFPVFRPGALFFLGDCHASQGDGEIVGTGIETSFEVAFRVALDKGRTIGWPRGEDDECIFTVGNARPLDQALQHATTEMLDWLSRDYGMDAVAASHFLGQTVRYDVANVFNPAYSVACRIARQDLARAGAKA